MERIFSRKIWLYRAIATLAGFETGVSETEANSTLAEIIYGLLQSL